MIRLASPASLLVVAVIHGPNLNLLGMREPTVYGTTSLTDIMTRCNQQVQTTVSTTLSKEYEQDIAVSQEANMQQAINLFEEIYLQWSTKLARFKTLPYTMANMTVPLLLGDAQHHGIMIANFQSNNEGDLVNYIQQLAMLQRSSPQAVELTVKIIINPAAYGHTSIALRDALLAGEVDFIEVHLSNIYRRETFRHHTYLQDIARAVISGLGEAGYYQAIDYYVKQYLTNLVMNKHN